MSLDPQSKPAKTLTYREKVMAGLVKPKPRSAVMRRSGPVSTKPRKKIKPVSARNSARMERYRIWVRWALRIIRAIKCARCGAKRPPDGTHDPHHPCGRAKNNIFKVIPLCRACHDWVHEHPNDAMLEGWLQPEYRGLGHNPKHPQPYRLLPGAAIFDVRYKASIMLGIETHQDSYPDLASAKLFIQGLLPKIGDGHEIWSIWDEIKMEFVVSSPTAKDIFKS